MTPEDLQHLEELAHREAMEEVALRVDDCWADMPLERLRRAGEIGWDIDPDGPTGPEKFDNVYGKVRCLALSNCTSRMWVYRIGTLDIHREIHL